MMKVFQQTKTKNQEDQIHNKAQFTTKSSSKPEKIDMYFYIKVILSFILSCFNESFSADKFKRPRRPNSQQNNCQKKA